MIATLTSVTAQTSLGTTDL